MIYMGDDISRASLEPQTKKPNTCPDCGEPTPEDFQDGDVCGICGYIKGAVNAH